MLFRSAIGALKGPLHGGANADVMRMLLEIGRTAGADRAEQVVRAKLARKEKIPGFGHRVYHTEDPRATHLRQMSRELTARAGEPEWFEMSSRIETLVKTEKKLNPNVDFYSATTYHALGIAVELFTPIFAVSRVSGSVSTSRVAAVCGIPHPNARTPGWSGISNFAVTTCLPGFSTTSAPSANAAGFPSTASSLSCTPANASGTRTHCWSNVVTSTVAVNATRFSSTRPSYRAAPSARSPSSRSGSG